MPFPAPFRRVLACALCLLFALPAAGAGGEDGPADIEALIDSGRYEDALARLPRPGRGVAHDSLFFHGLAAIGAAQRPGLAGDRRAALLDGAIAALRLLLIEDPGLARVRLELARAFFFKGEDGLARRHFERVLAGKPPPNVVANIGRFLAEMRARRRWSFHLGATLAPDSNVAGTPKTLSLQAFGLGEPDEIGGIEPARSGIGLAFWGGGEYRLPLGRGLGMRAGADAARREYRRSRFDRTFLSAHLGPRWLLDGRTEASLLASARQLWTGGASDSRDLGARLELAWRAGPRLTAFVRSSWHRRRYRGRRDLDGPVVDAVLSLGWAVSPTLRMDVRGGYARERPRYERWRNRSLSLGLGVSAALPRGFTVGGGGTLRWTAFRGVWLPNTPSGVPRRDVTRSLHVSAYNRGWTLGGFSPELVLAQEQRTTNAQLYDFERIRGELRLVRQF